MAHQCLKCGHAYPDGSPQILKGCEECKGSRFFYTDQPLDDAARAVVRDRTDADIERIALGKGPERTAPAPERRIPTKDELPLGSDKDWVELGPNYLRNVVEDVVRRANDRRPVFRVGAEPAASKPTLAEWIRENGGDVGDDEGRVATKASGPGEQESDGVATDSSSPASDGPDLIDDLMAPEREDAWRRESGADAEPRRVTAGAGADAVSPAADSDASGADEVVYKRAPRPVPKPVSLAGVPVDAQDERKLQSEARRLREAVEAEPGDSAAAEPLPDAEDAAVPTGGSGSSPAEGDGSAESLYPEGQRPETVGISAPGVYELDVKRLMEHNPIVVHKDGTYSLHLPSLMDSVNKGRRR